MTDQTASLASFTGEDVQKKLRKRHRAERRFRLYGVAAILFALAFLGFFASVAAVNGWGIPYHCWRILAIVSSAISLLALILFWNALILLVPHKLGNIAVNLILIIGLLILNWPADKQLGW